MTFNDFGIQPSSQMSLDDKKSLTGIMAGIDYDHIYIEAWKSTIARCVGRLDNGDFREALQVKSAELFRWHIEQMLGKYHDGSTEADVLRLLIPTLEHYDQFSRSFVELMRKEVEVSWMWGLLFLVIKLALESPGALERTDRMVKTVVNRLAFMNDTISSMTKTEQKKSVYVEVSRELVNLWLNIISAFRNSAATGLEETTWEDITAQYTKVLGQLEEATSRITRVLSLALNKLHLDDFQRVQALLREEASDPAAAEQQNSPIAPMTPGPPHDRFYGRSDELKRLRELLKPRKEEKRLLSVAIYGLGGVGKSQIALSLAHTFVDDYDAIFWIHAETLTSLDQSFEKAVNWVGLGTPNQEAKNHIIFLDWLKRTDKSWLLIFDNAENPKWVRQYWPFMDRGSALITSRKHIFGIHPAAEGFEVKSFNDQDGANFTLKMLHIPQSSLEDLEAARDLSKLVGGHALALTQACSLILNRKWSILKYLDMHYKYPKEIRKKNTRDLVHNGYEEGVETVFLMSFQTLSKESPEAAKMLSILSVLSPEDFLESIFCVELTEELPIHLGFCHDEFGVSENITELISLGLVHRDAGTDSLSIHRLVQSEFRYYILDQLQDAFNDAAELLYHSFPKQTYGRSFEPDFEQCSKLIQHVYCLRDHADSARKTSRPLSASKYFCRLMCNAAYYLVEKGATKELETTISVSMKAFQSTGLIGEEPLAYAHLCNSAALEREMSGDFKSAETLLQTAYEIRRNDLPAGHEDIWVVTNNLGNLSLSLGRYEDALRYHRLCQDTLATSVKGNVTMNLNNLCRALTGLGRFPEAFAMLNRAKELHGNAGFRSYYYWAGNLHMAQSNLDEAQSMYTKGRERLVSDGNGISADMATCLYKLASIRLRKYHVSGTHEMLVEAVNLFEQAVTMMQLCKVADCEVSRAAYMLSVALYLRGDDNDGAAQWRDQAESVRRAMQKEQYIAEAHGEWAYDNMVESWVR